MQHYSAVNYWTPGWTYPRERLREPFPRQRCRFAPAVFNIPLLSLGTPERTFSGTPRGQNFDAPTRGQAFAAALRGVTFQE
jgi:hypothetical protein